MKTPVEILQYAFWDITYDDKGTIIEAMKIYAKQWIDQAAEVAMLQAEKGLPVGDAIYALKDLIDKQ